MKCTNCRAKDIELLTKWERIKDWMFYRLFPKDIVDLSQNKYTQGFGDGYKVGRESERQQLKNSINPDLNNYIKDSSYTITGLPKDL